jgi:hypothetical protein
MLVACRQAGLSAFEAYHARVQVGAQFWPTQGSSQGIVGKAERRGAERCAGRAGLAVGQDGNRAESSRHRLSVPSVLI